jgi:hypothetical protein
MTRRGFFAGLGALVGAAVLKPLEVVAPAPKTTFACTQTLLRRPNRNVVLENLDAEPYTRITVPMAFYSHLPAKRIVEGL